MRNYEISLSRELSAMQNTHWEELQQLREKEHGLKRGQKIVIVETCKEEHKPARKVKRIYTVIELYKHCVLLKDEKGVDLHFLLTHFYTEY